MNKSIEINGKKVMLHAIFSYKWVEDYQARDYEAEKKIREKWDLMRGMKLS